jgi:6-pyruvoyltetrahydropterin/6-carboxytetrahydropterin synthase
VHTLTIHAVFSAAHAIVIRGIREPVHGHNWRVSAVVAGPALDQDGLLLDFHALERSLAAIIAPFHNNDLNRTPPFDRVNPTAEHVAKHIAESLAGRIDPEAVKRGVGVVSVSVTEAEGCVAKYSM